MGSSARSNTLLNSAGITSELILAISDVSTYKQGLLTPGSCIPVISPNDLPGFNPRSAIILAWNFADEILSTVNLGPRLSHVLMPLPGDLTLYAKEGKLSSLI